MLRPASAAMGRLPWLPPRRVGPSLLIAGGLAGLVGVSLPGLLASLDPLRIVGLVAGLFATLVVVWLALRHVGAALALAFFLLCAVRVEPSPVDIVFALLIITSFFVSRPHVRVPVFVAVPLGAFALLTLLSMVNATGTSRAIRFEFITLYMIALAIWLTWIFADARWVRLAMKSYVIAAVVSGILGAVALYLPLPGKRLLTYGGARAQGLFKDPNVYSAFLVPAALLLLEDLVSPRLFGWSRRVRAAAFAIATVGVVVAYSRAAWLNFALGVTTLLVVQGLRHGGYRRATKSLLLLLAGSAVGLAVLYVTGSIAFLQHRSHLQRYDTSRFTAQTDAFEEMTHHVFGYGPGQVEEHLAISTHSAFARAAFEQGLLGLASFVLLTAGTLFCAVLLARRRTHFHGVGTAALLGIWIGQVANGFFIDTFHWRHLWVIAALVWCGYMLPPEREKRQPPDP